SNPDNSVFSVGIYGKTKSQTPEFLTEPYIKVVHFDDIDKVLQRTQHHQLDLLLRTGDNPTYWINTESTHSAAAEKLLLPSTTQFKREEISGRKIRYVHWVIPGVLGMNLMFGALFGAGYVNVRSRHNGVLK